MPSSKKSFEEAIAVVVERDPRFHRDAYPFLRDALDYTMKENQKNEDGEMRHVSGDELLKGFRDYVLEEFGPMVPVVLEEWGIHRCEDVGDMVFNLIEVGVFGKSETDRREDFSDVFDFEDAFVTPFRPRGTKPVQGDTGTNRLGPGKGETPGSL